MLEAAVSVCPLPYSSNRCRKEKLTKIRAYLDHPAEEPPTDEEEETKNGPWLGQSHQNRP